MRKTIASIMCLFALFSFANGQVRSRDSAAHFDRQSIEVLKRQVSKYSQSVANLEGRFASEASQAEEKLFGKLSVSSKDLGLDDFQTYMAKFNNAEMGLGGAFSDAVQAKAYLPKLDSMLTVVHFLTKNSQSLVSSDLVNSIDGLEELKTSFEKLSNINSIIEARKLAIQSKLKDLGKGGEHLQNYLKKIELYKGKINELRAQFNSPDKVISGVISTLSRQKQFRQFFARNSIMSQFMRLPVEGDPVDSEVLEGLQTRRDIEKIYLERFGDLQLVPGSSVGGGALPGMTGHLADTKLLLDTGRLFRRTGSENNHDANLKPKRKLKDMVHFGINFQTVRAQGIFPTMTDIGVQLRFDVSERFSAGVGASGKIGLGSNIQNINITGQGVSVRSFVDGRIKGGFYLTGALEMNYLTQIDKFEQLRDMSLWRFSGLMGLTRRFKLSGSRTGSVQVLYDFFNRSNGLQTPAFLVRVGYNF